MTTEQLPTGDKRGLAWLNEVGTLRALAHNKNEPMYVARIAAMSPELWQMSKDKPKRFTKVGVKAACRRLVEREILIVQDMKTPNKKERTPHFQISPRLGTFAKIVSDYGLGILDDIRGTEFAQAVIASDLDDWLKAKVGTNRPVRDLAPSNDLKLIDEFASRSTLALQVLLSDTLAMDQHADKVESYRVQARVRHLMDVMHLAMALDVAKMPAAQLVAEDLRAQITLATTFKFGSFTIDARTAYDSENIAATQRKLLGRIASKPDDAKGKNRVISKRERSMSSGKTGTHGLSTAKKEDRATKKGEGIGEEGRVVN